MRRQRRSLSRCIADTTTPIIRRNIDNDGQRVGAEVVTHILRETVPTEAATTDTVRPGGVSCWVVLVRHTAERHSVAA
jgi:hypothetical protein